MTNHRLLGLWQLDPDLRTAQAAGLAWEALAELCAEHDVLPVGNKARAIFATRTEAIHTALMLDVPTVDLLRLVETYGFGPTSVFLAAAVDVRPSWAPADEAVAA